MSFLGRLSCLAATLALLGCTSPSPALQPSTPTPDSVASREAACLAAVAGVVDAVKAQVARYEPAPVNTATPSAGTTASPSASAAAAPGVDLDTALQAAREASQANLCDPTAFTRKVAADLGALRPQGPLATAVLARLTASITGQVPEQPVDRVVRVTESLTAVIAAAPAGSTLRLERGDHRVIQTLVLLDGITLTGEGKRQTRLLSSAPDAAVLDVTPGKVTISKLAIVRDAGVPGSGIVTGPEAALVLDAVTISGGRLSKAKSGGAAVHLSGSASDKARGTTLQVDGSTFADNAWAGIVATGRHRLSVKASVFDGSGECGICFLDATDGSVDASRFDDNRVGVAALGGSAPVLLKNVFRGGQVGIQVDGTATPGLRSNAITKVSKAAVIYGGTAAGTIEGTTCPDVQFGIVVGTTSAPTMLRNPCPLARGA